jgi:hypothetical protein
VSDSLYPFLGAAVGGVVSAYFCLLARREGYRRYARSKTVVRGRGREIERFVPSGKEAWYLRLPYDRDMLISERRLVPVNHGPVPNLSE